MSLPPSQDLPRFHVLVADGDPSIRKACCAIIASQGMTPHEAEFTAPVRSFLLARGADIFLIDETIARGEGSQLMEELRELRSDIAIVWMTSASTLQRAVEAMRGGASDYLIKPFSAEELATVLRRLADRRDLDVSCRTVRERLRNSTRTGMMLGESPEMEKLFRIVARVAQSTHPALILGESGTGKETVARAIHANGPAANQPFIPVDCGSLARNLIEGELLGRPKGTSRSQLPCDGALVVAGTGTIFLDTVEELPLELQAKLVRVLQDKTVQPLSAGNAVPVKARILAAGDQDLPTMVEQGKFRRDLWQRLGVVKLTLTPLRERKDDIPLLAAYFLERNTRETGRRFRLSAQTLSYLMEYSWPENVRELANAIDRACNMTSGEVIEMAEMTTAIRDAWNHSKTERSVRISPTAQTPPVETLAEMEKRAILTMLDQTNGDKLLAARLLDIGKTTLYRKLKEYGVQV